MSDGGPNPKRIKLFRACETCVIAKTRCDDLTTGGCALCRKKNRHCSLAEQASNGPDLEEECQEAKARLEMVEARAWDLELRLRQLESSSSAAVTSITSIPGLTTNAMSHTPAGAFQHAFPPETDMEAFMDLGKTDMWPFDERVLSIICRRRYPDAIGRGLVSKETMDTSFQLWKHRWTPILPLAPFLLTTTPTPSHPFVRIAILSHMSATNTPALHSLINESFAHLMQGDISTDAILALLILSLNPCSTTIPSAIRLISAAYQIGVALGLEANEQASLAMGEHLCYPWWRERYEEMLLWEAVKLHYNLIHIFAARPPALLPSSVKRFPDYPTDNIRQSTRHLQSATAMIVIWSDFILALSTAEAETRYTIPDLPGVTDNWVRAREDLNTFRNTDRAVGIETMTLHLEFALVYRATRFVQYVPAPVSADLKQSALNHVGRDLVSISSNVIDIWNDTDLDDTHQPLTSQMIHTVVLAIATILAIHSAVFRQHPNFLGLNIEKTYAAERKIRAMDGMISAVLQRHREVFAAELENSDDLATAPSAGTEFGFGGDQLNLIDPDLSAWSWLFNGYQPGADSSTAL